MNSQIKAIISQQKLRGNLMREWRKTAGKMTAWGDNRNFMYSNEPNYLIN